MKKSIFLFFAAILCAMSVGAVNMTGGEVLYLTPNSNWLQEGDGKAPRFAAYFYGTGEAWESMTAVEGETNLYQLSVPVGNWTNVIFCRMNGNTTENTWSNKYNQTNDLAYDGTNNHYTVTNGAWSNGDGTWSVYTPPTTETKYYVTGTSNLVGGEGWKANEVELVLSDGKYTHTFTGLTKGETYELKVTKNGNWDEGVWGAQNLNNISYYDISGNNDDNIVLKPSQDGDLTVSFSNNIISLSGITAPKRYITGASLVGNWASDAQLMNYANGKHTFTKTLAAGTYAFKITDGTWNNSWGNGSQDYEFTTTAGEVTIEFDDTDKSINVITPEINYYITGNTDLVGGDGWKANEIKMTETSGIYTYEFTNLAADKLYLMKVTNGSWSENYGHDALQNTDAKVENYGGNIAFYLSAAGNVNVSFDLANKKITLTGSFAAIPNVKIYCVNTDGWETVYAYAWDGESKNAEYPGEDITSKTDGTVNGFNVHYVEFKLGKYANVIFGCGKDDCKTGDMTVADHVGKYYYSGTWYNSANDIPNPADIKCYLMGNGNANGVEMTPNPNNNNEYMLLDHYISAPFNFKYGEEVSDQVENYDFPGIAWANGNITLPEGYYDFYFKKDSKKAYIAAVYLRDVTNTWGTICLPHASTSFSGAKFYEVSSLDPTKGLWLDEIEAGAQLVAGKPYVFEATASTIKVTYTDKAVAAPQAGANGLTGTFTDIAAAADGVLVGNYIIGGNKVHVATAQNDLPANRAYINAALVPNKVQAKIPGRRRVCMGENATTGLDQIVAPEGQAVKAIVNGQLIIIRDGVKYNVQGQKL